MGHSQTAVFQAKTSSVLQETRLHRIDPVRAGETKFICRCSGAHGATRNFGVQPCGCERGPKAIWSCISYCPGFMWRFPIDIYIYIYTYQSEPVHIHARSREQPNHVFAANCYQSAAIPNSLFARFFTRVRSSSDVEHLEWGAAAPGPRPGPPAMN